MIVGEQELADGVVTVRPLRAEFGDDTSQQTVARADLVAHLSTTAHSARKHAS